MPVSAPPQGNWGGGLPSSRSSVEATDSRVRPGRRRTSRRGTDRPRGRRGPHPVHRRETRRQGLLGPEGRSHRRVQRDQTGERQRRRTGLHHAAVDRAHPSGPARRLQAERAERRRPHGRDRRRLRLPEPGARPRRLPLPVRPVRVHDGQRLPADHRPERRDLAAAVQRGLGREQALDVDAVSAAAPDAKIVVVQAKSASFADLGTAVVTASKQAGVVAISNSYGGGDASDATYGTYYNHPGIAVTASTGDNGYQGGSYPASSSLRRRPSAVRRLLPPATSRGWTETVWSGAGSGCSTYNTALSAAASFDTGCAKRAMADVSAAADPGKGGMAIYYPTSQDELDLGAVRWHQRVRPDHRRGLRPVGQHRRLRERAPVRAHQLAVRRDHRAATAPARRPSGATPGPAGTARPASARRTVPVPSDRTGGPLPRLGSARSPVGPPPPRRHTPRCVGGLVRLLACRS